jgi:hypothetical protein
MNETLNKSNMNIKDNLDIVNVYPLKKKKKELTLYIEYNMFDDYNYIFKELSSFFSLNNRYSIITRVCYINKDNYMYRDEDIGEGGYIQWKTLGDQISIKHYSDDILLEDIKEYHNIIENRLNESMDIYNYSNILIQGIQIIVYRVDYTDIIKRKTKFSSNLLGEHKDLVNVSKTSEVLNKMIPLTMDINKFGIALNTIIENNVVNSITLVDGSNINFIERINKYSDIKKICLNSNVKFFQSKVNNKDILITVESYYEDNKLKNDINVYNLNGMKISNMVDKEISSNSFTRVIGNVKVYINKTGIYNKEIIIDFKPIYPNKIKGFQSKLFSVDDYRVGTMDLETYKEDEMISKTYAIGFYAARKVHTFYIDKDIDSDAIILKCLNTMLVEKYHGYTFYIHNFGKFDVAFILRALIRANELEPSNYFFTPRFRDNVMIAMDITKKFKNRLYKITLVDSYNILQSSLDKLCTTFNTDVKKSFFPYNFINKKNLFYIGNKPDIKYYLDVIYSKYSNIPKENWSLDNKNTINSLEKGDIEVIKKLMDFYSNIPTNNWSIKEQTITYLEKDLISLYNVIDKFKKNIYINYHTHITNSFTISSIAMNIFLRRFYNNNIPLIKTKSIFNNIKKSYYGGITEVYKPYGKNLYYYDVNSLYPYAALNSMPGLNCVYQYNINKNICDLYENLFGFFYCKIETPKNDYIGLLPVRNKDGIIMPLGHIEGWYFSEELKFAYKHNYKIDVISGYQFDKSEDVFNKYIHEFYKIKSTKKDLVEKSIAKSLLNNLLGKLGMNIDKFITKLVSEDELQNILQSKVVRDVNYIGNKILVTFGDEISLDICNAHDVNYSDLYKYEMLNKKGSTQQNRLHDVSVATSSAITSYSRIYMNKIKLDILNKGGSIYYTDTDSIVTDLKLDDNLVGKDIGQFKLEHEIEEAYFISSKTYCLKTKTGHIIKKSKGLSSKVLIFDDYISLFSGQNVERTRLITIRNYNQGSVTVNVPQKIKLNGNSYTKREKIFDNNNIWINTKPLYI